MSFLLIIDITFSCIFLSVPITEVVLIDEALPSEREATYFTLRVFFLYLSSGFQVHSVLQ